MQTVVMFFDTSPETSPSGTWKNRLYSRSLRKIAFIDNKHPREGDYPKDGEQWLVEIVRENQNAKGGCFILKPIRRIEREQIIPLVHGMYDLEVVQGTIILTPKEQGKFWVLSPEAKKAMLETAGAHAMVINHGGNPTWPKRRPAESVFENEAKRLLDDAS
jgi:hypothetical protein